ncbi:MAG: gfo/Idh/MocA family oxidoreductase, partial [Nanoarchaeota archaeon]|nr:gfo/Idh/MocA family oxidoreductase [Nanoarchaeota archaeon]
PRPDTEEPLKKECEHFIDCVLNNKTPQSDGNVGFVAVKILEMAEESMKNNSKFIDINYN